MENDTVIELKDRVETKDFLTEVLKDGAKQMLAAAIQEEVAEFLSSHTGLQTEKGKQRFVRNGYLPERSIQTGIGHIDVKVPRVRDREPDGNIKFKSSLIPPYLKRSRNIEEFLPLLYLKGISTNDFSDVLEPLFGKEAKSLSPGVISRLKSHWSTEASQWKKRDLSKKHYVYWWADGVYFQARMENAKDCVLVIIGVTDKGKKELIAIDDGYRESKDTWKELLLDLKSRGLTGSPKVAVGDGAMGFWGALNEVYPETQHQRCWVHKTANILSKLPKSLHAKAKSDIHEIWMSPTREQAHKAFDRFIETYGAKYPKAVKCLENDRDTLMTFYDYPAEHWKHLRTTNPIESMFATVRHRTYKSKGCFSRDTILAMVFKLAQSAEKRWNRLHGFNYLADVIQGVVFKDGIKQSKQEDINLKVAV